MKNIQRHGFIFNIILSVCVVVPLTNDIFISGIPEMRRVFIGSNISLVLSVSLIGLALAQIFYGPFSDRFGRKPTLLVGLFIFITASIQVMLVNDFTVLLMGRFLQAIGICSATVSALAIARDTCDKEELIGATSFIMAILAVGPATAPLAGSLLNHLWGWRASFEFLTILGCFYILWIAIFLEETHIHKNLEALIFRKILKNYLILGKHSQFLKYCITSGFSYGVLFSYISLSSYFIIEKLHYSLISFGFIVAINAIAIIIMAFLTPKIIKKLSLQNTIKLGLIIIFAAGVLMWLLNIFVSENILTFMAPIFIATIGIGIIRPAASAGAMQLVDSKIAGSAAAFYNFFSFVSGAFATMCVAKVIHHATGFGIFMAMMGALAFINVKFYDEYNMVLKANTFSNNLL